MPQIRLDAMHKQNIAVLLTLANVTLIFPAEQSEGRVATVSVAPGAGRGRNGQWLVQHTTTNQGLGQC